MHCSLTAVTRTEASSDVQEHLASTAGLSEPALSPHIAQPNKRALEVLQELRATRPKHSNLAANPHVDVLVQQTDKPFGHYTREVCDWHYTLTGAHGNNACSCDWCDILPCVAGQ